LWWSKLCLLSMNFFSKNMAFQCLYLGMQ
jgi:hypothetical protein